MENVEVVEKKIVITDPKFLLEDYGKKVFSMFGGEEHRVELCCHRDVWGQFMINLGMKYQSIKMRVNGLRY